MGMFSCLRRVLTPLLGLILLGAPAVVLAETAEDAQAVIKNASEEVMAAIRENKAKGNLDQAKIRELVETLLVPHFDALTMSRLALGKHWRKASKEQKLAFMREFRMLLIHTYSTALGEYEDQEVNYKPAKLGSKGKRVTVRTEIVPKHGPKIPIDYAMRLRKSGWKVNDVRIDGISLVTNYRSTFNTQVKESGLDGVIEGLRARNTKEAEAKKGEVKDDAVKAPGAGEDSNAPNEGKAEKGDEKA